MQDNELKSLQAASSGPHQLGEGPRVQVRARTRWRDYNSQLAWERLVIPEQEGEEVVGVEKKDIWTGKLTDGLNV